MKRERGRPKKDRTGEPELCSIGIKLKKQLWQDFKRVAALREESATSIIEDLMSHYIHKYGKELKDIQKIKAAMKKKK